MGSVRHRFEYNGRLVYEWQQSLREVEVFIQVRPMRVRRIHTGYSRARTTGRVCLPRRCLPA